MSSAARWICRVLKFVTATRVDEAITDPFLGQNHFPLVGSVFDLLAQASDECAQRFFVLAMAHETRGLQERVVGNDAPAAANKDRQDFELRRRQPDRFAVAHHTVVKDVDPQVSAMIDGFLASGLDAAAQQGADSRQKFTRAETGSSGAGASWRST